MNYFITAIGTDSGKTLVSAILTEALQADYWKPVQAGFPRDTDTVKALLGNDYIYHPEAYLLNTPASPHAAAKIDKVTIELGKINLPTTDNDLIIEGAGGCLVPLNDQDFVLDIAVRLNLEVVLVSNIYLGSINHTLLTAEAIRNRGLKVKGIVFNGDRNEETERIILHHTGYRCLLRIDQHKEVTTSLIKEYAKELKQNWYAKEVVS